MKTVHEATPFSVESISALGQIALGVKEKNDKNLYFPLFISCSLIHMAGVPDALLDNTMTLKWKSFAQEKQKTQK